MSARGRPAPRPDLEGLRPYRTSEASGGRILLHANENPYPLPEGVMEEILAEARRLELNRYPDPEGRDLAELLASYAGVDPSWVWLGDGSNEVLLQCCLAYGGAGRRALLFEPTYRMHYRQARAAGTAVEIDRRGEGFEIDVERALKTIARLAPEIVFVCSPNNPTGTLTPLEDLRRIAEASPGLVVLDEAYHEFCGMSFVDGLDAFPNVVVVRTLSKAFRLAGVRFGYGIAQPDTLEPLARVRMPYAQSAFTQAAVRVVLRRRDEVLGRVGELVAERDRVAGALATLPGVEVFESGTNFLLFRHPKPARALGHLASEGIVIRDFSTLEGCEGCLRVTVGRPDENDAFLEAMTVLE